MINKAETDEVRGRKRLKRKMNEGVKKLVEQEGLNFSRMKSEAFCGGRQEVNVQILIL